MENKFPVPIINEKDLKVYEDFLNADSPKKRNFPKTANKSYVPETLVNSVFLPAYLKSHIGKLMKIECLIGNRIEIRIGTLLEVGADFLVIKLKENCSSMVIEGSSVKFITIIHNNDINNARIY